MTIRTLHGTIRGRTVEFDEAPGIPDGAEVEVQMTPVTGMSLNPPEMSEGLAKIYAILGERYDSGHTDTAARHNEHQP